MIYEIEVPDGRIIEVEGEPGQEELAVKKVREYLAKEAGGKIYNESQFDYQTGISDLALRAQLDTAETKEEKERVLSRYVGSSGFIYDSNGRLAVTPNGQRRLGLKPLNKNIIVDEEGISIADFADFAGTVGPIVGAIAALNPYGRTIKQLKPILKNDRLVRIGATALGSAGGKAAEEAFEIINATQMQDASEISKELLQEGIIGGASQGIFEVGGKALSALLGRKAPIVDIDIARAIAQGADPDEVADLSRRLGRTATFEDVKKAQESKQIATFDAAAVSQRALGRAIPGRIQAAAETVFGRTERDKELIKYGTGRLEKLLKDQGDVSASLEDFAQATQTGKLTQRQIEEIKRDLSTKANKSQQSLDEFINNAIKMIDNGALTNNPDRIAVGQLLRDQIKKAYDSNFGQFIDEEGKEVAGIFVKRAQEIDARIEAAGLREISSGLKIKLEPLIKKVDDLIKSNPGLELIQAVEGVRGGKIGVIRQILANAEKQGGMSIEGLSNLRSAMLAVQRSAGSEAKEVTRNIKLIVDDINKIFDELSEGSIVSIIQKSPGLRRTFGDEKNRMIRDLSDLEAEDIMADPSGLVPQVKTLIDITKDLKKYNADYRKAVRPFDNSIVAMIRKDAAYDSYDVDEIIKYVVKKDRPKILEGVLRAIPDNLSRERVKKEIQKDFIREALDSPNVKLDTGEVNPVAFANYFRRQLGSTRKVLFDDIPDLERVLNDFSKINRKIDAKKLEKIVDRIETKDLSKAVDDLVRNENKLHEAETDRLFRRIETAEPDEIVNLVFRNGQAGNIERLKNQVFKNKPEEFANLQQDSMRELLRLVQGPGKTVDEVFKPDALERALNAKGDATLKAMFGDETVKSLRSLVRDLRVMTASEGGGAGTLIAGAVAVNAFNISMLPTLAQLYFVGSILRNPSTVRRLAKSDAESVNYVMRAFKDAIRLIPPVLLGQEIADVGEDVSDFTEETLEDLDVDLDLGETTGQIREAIREIPRPPQVSLDLPEVKSIPTATLARRGPTLLPNPRDQEIAEFLS